MAAYKPQYQTLNMQHFPDQKLEIQTHSFHLFQRLPTEIKMEIWRLIYAPCQRLITIRLHEANASQEELDPYACQSSPDLFNLPEFNLQQEGTSGPCTREICRISIDQKPRRNPLMQVSREWRRFAQERFRLPLRSKPGCDGPQPILWLDPENDHIFIAEFSIPTRNFISFINHMKVSDPRGEGLLQLAFDSRCEKSLQGLRALAREVTLSNDLIKTFREAIFGLKSLWFIHLLREDSRIMAGPLSGTRNWQMGLNRSIPIFPHAVEFDYFKSDPRPIQSSLKGQTVWEDPREPVATWVSMEKKLGLHTGENKKGASASVLRPMRDISHILAMSGRKGYKSEPYCDVFCSQTMDMALRIEQERVNHVASMEEYFAFIMEMEPEESKMNLVSAAGFWVFPAGTFDTLSTELGGKAYQDLTGHQPALGLFELRH